MILYYLCFDFAMLGVKGGMSPKNDITFRTLPEAESYFRENEASGSIYACVVPNNKDLHVSRWRNGEMQLGDTMYVYVCKDNEYELGGGVLVAAHNQTQAIMVYGEYQTYYSESEVKPIPYSTKAIEGLVFVGEKPKVVFEFDGR